MAMHGGWKKIQDISCWMVSLPASGRRSAGDGDWSIRHDQIAETFITRKTGCCVTLRMQLDDLNQRTLYDQKQHAAARDQQVAPTHTSRNYFADISAKRPNYTVHKVLM